MQRDAYRGESTNVKHNKQVQIRYNAKQLKVQFVQNLCQDQENVPESYLFCLRELGRSEQQLSYSNSSLVSLVSLFTGCCGDSLYCC